MSIPPVSASPKPLNQSGEPPKASSGRRNILAVVAQVALAPLRLMGAAFAKIRKWISPSSTPNEDALSPHPLASQDAMIATIRTLEQNNVRLQQLNAALTTSLFLQDQALRPKIEEQKSQLDALRVKITKDLNLPNYYRGVGSNAIAAKFDELLGHLRDASETLMREKENGRVLEQSAERERQTAQRALQERDEAREELQKFMRELSRVTLGALPSKDSVSGDQADEPFSTELSPNWGALSPSILHQHSEMNSRGLSPDGSRAFRKSPKGK